MKHVQIFSLETNIQKPNASSASLLPNDACFPVSTFLGSFADTNPLRFRLEETRSNPYTKSPSLCAPPHTFGSYFDRKSNSFPRLSHLRKQCDFPRSSEWSRFRTHRGLSVVARTQTAAGDLESSAKSPDAGDSQRWWWSRWSWERRILGYRNLPALPVEEGGLMSGPAFLEYWLRRCFEQQWANQLPNRSWAFGFWRFGNKEYRLVRFLESYWGWEGAWYFKRYKNGSKWFFLRKTE